jgi:hypothetical protein
MRVATGSCSCWALVLCCAVLWGWVQPSWRLWTRLTWCDLVPHHDSLQDILVSRESHMERGSDAVNALNTILSSEGLVGSHAQHPAAAPVVPVGPKIPLDEVRRCCWWCQLPEWDLTGTSV